MTEQQMTNVKGYYENEGLTAGINADAIKPKLGSMRTIIKRVHVNKLGGTPETRQTAKIETIQKVDELEMAYWESVTPLKETSKRDAAMALRELGIERIKGRTPQEQLASHFYRRFERDIRTLTGDKKMRVYRPNDTTRKMLMGVSR
jgi:hypothetical protein